MISRFQFEENFLRLSHTIRWTKMEIDTVIEDDERSVQLSEDEEYQEYLATDCRKAVRGMCRLLASTAESLGLKTVVSEVATLRERYDTAELDLGVSMNRFRKPFDIEFIQYAEDIAVLLRAHFPHQRGSSKLGDDAALRNILRHTKQILGRKNIVVRNEPQIGKEVYEVVRLVYPDALPDRTLKFGKKDGYYIPDISIRSIHTCVEFKLAETDDEYKSLLDGLMNDVLNYGDAEYQNFFGVVCVGNLTTVSSLEFEHEMELRMKNTSVTTNWAFEMVEINVDRAGRTV